MSLSSSKLIKWLLLMLAVLCLTILTHFDAPLYRTPIVQVTRVQETSSHRTRDYFSNEDRSANQRLTVRFLNTKRQNQQITISNQYVASEVMTQKFRVGQRLLLSHKKWWSIIGQKRDTLLVFAIALMLALTIGLTKRVSLQIIGSLVLNFIFFILAILLDINFENAPAVLIFALLTIVFAFVTLLMVLGWHRQFLIVFLATILSTAAGIGIGAATIALNHANGVHFEYMDFVTQFPIPLFYSELMIGVLGAAMDESSDISAMMFGMQREQPDRTFREYFLAGMHVGRDIVGSLTNVLFMVFIANTLPMVFLYLRNGNTWSYTIDMAMMLGMLSTIVSAIGIVLTVPITSWLAASLLSAEKRQAS